MVSLTPLGSPSIPVVSSLEPVLHVNTRNGVE